MGVRTNLTALTLLPAEIAAAQGIGDDAVGNLEFAAIKCADAIGTLSALTKIIPAGANLTAIQAAITALS